MGRKYRHMTASGGFNQPASDTAQAKERERRGFKPFSRAERFNEVMSSSAQQNERKARAIANEQGFAAQFDSELGRSRKNRRGRGNIGISSY